MDNYLHPNTIKASNRLRITGLLYILYYIFFDRNAADTVFVLYVVFATAFILFLLSFLLRSGFKWSRWILAILILWQLRFELITLLLPAANIVEKAFGLVIFFLPLSAAIMLFVPFKTTNSEARAHDTN